jgi:hypothetical protein
MEAESLRGTIFIRSLDFAFKGQAREDGSAALAVTPTRWSRGVCWRCRKRRGLRRELR